MELPPLTPVCALRPAAAQEEPPSACVSELVLRERAAPTGALGASGLTVPAGSLQGGSLFLTLRNAVAVAIRLPAAPTQAAPEIQEVRCTPEPCSLLIRRFNAASVGG